MEDTLKTIQFVYFSSILSPNLNWVGSSDSLFCPCQVSFTELCFRALPQVSSKANPDTDLGSQTLLSHPPSSREDGQGAKARRLSEMTPPPGRASPLSVTDTLPHPCLGCQETPHGHQPQSCFLSQLVLTYFLVLKLLHILWQVISKPCNLVRISII